MAEVEYSIVIPCFNEEEILASTLQTLYHDLGAISEIVVVDDGSTDDTYEICKKFARGVSNVKCSTLPHKGRGSALKQGIMNSSGQFCILSAADIPISKEQIRNLTNLFEEGADLVLFSKNIGGSRIAGRSRLREFLSHSFSLCCRIVLQVPYSDLQGMKAIRRNIAVDLSRITHDDGFLFDTELAYLAHKKGYRIVELPWKLTDNIRKSKVKLRHIIRMCRGIFLIRFSHMKAEKP